MIKEASNVTAFILFANSMTPLTPILFPILGGEGRVRGSLQDI